MDGIQNSIPIRSVSRVACIGPGGSGPVVACEVACTGPASAGPEGSGEEVFAGSEGANEGAFAGPTWPEGSGPVVACEVACTWPEGVGEGDCAGHTQPKRSEPEGTGEEEISANS